MLACKEKEPCFVSPADKPWYEQVLQYNHAVQAFRGQNLLLALVDQDEYLAIKKHLDALDSTVRDLAARLAELEARTEQQAAS